MLNELGIPAPPPLSFDLPFIPKLGEAQVFYQIRSKFSKNMKAIKAKLKEAHQKEQSLIDKIPDQLVNP